MVGAAVFGRPTGQTQLNRKRRFGQMIEEQRQRDDAVGIDEFDGGQVKFERAVFAPNAVPLRQNIVVRGAGVKRVRQGNLHRMRAFSLFARSGYACVALITVA